MKYIFKKNDKNIEINNFDNKKEEYFEFNFIEDNIYTKFAKINEMQNNIYYNCINKIKDALMYDDDIIILPVLLIKKNKIKYHKKL